MILEKCILHNICISRSLHFYFRLGIDCPFLKMLAAIQIVLFLCAKILRHALIYHGFIYGIVGVTQTFKTFLQNINTNMIAFYQEIVVQTIYVMWKN